MKSKAFTLIELLVVIAIIAILAAILFPVFAQAKEAAKKSSCLSNTKQITTAFYTYVIDYDDSTPVQMGSEAGYDWWKGPGAGKTLGWLDDGATSNWAKEIYPYTKNLGVYLCATATPDLRYPDLAPGNVPGQGKTSYVASYAFLERSMTSVSKPAESVVIHEASKIWKSTQTRPYWYASQVCSGFDMPDLDLNHMGGTNLAFLDGHAKYMKREAITLGMLGATDNRPQYGKSTDHLRPTAQATSDLYYWPSCRDDS